MRIVAEMERLAEQMRADGLVPPAPKQRCLIWHSADGVRYNADHGVEICELEGYADDVLPEAFRDLYPPQEK